ncbi:MAG TPA: hypothetical protein EYP08_01845 [Pyrodictiaceae archaeon]|nr:hypothetical protein [Pyrodictiaceae archaeon]
MSRSKKMKTIVERFTIAVLEASELALFIILGATVFIGMGFLVAKLCGIFTGKSELTNIVESKAPEDVLTFDILVIMDILLLLIIGIDLLRTLAVSIIERKLYVQAALEAAIIAVVREIISAELRHRAATDILLFSAVILVLVLSILIAKKYL